MAEIIMDLPQPQSLALNAIRIDSVQVSATMASIQYSLGHKTAAGAFGAVQTSTIELFGEQFDDFSSVIDYNQVALKLGALLTQQA